MKYLLFVLVLFLLFIDISESQMTANRSSSGMFNNLSQSGGLMRRRVAAVAVNPNQLIFDNFESGSFNASWVTTTGCEIGTPASFGIAAPAGGGTNICKAPAGLRFDPSGGATTDVWIKMQAYSGDMAGAMEDRVAILRQADQQLMMQTKYSASWGGLQYSWYRGGDAVGDVTGTIAANTWYTLKFHIVVSATVGVFDIYVNGTRILNLANRNSGTTPINDIWFGTSAGTSTTRFFDNVGIYTADPDL